MKIMGVIFNNRLTWDDHKNHLISQIIPLLRSLAKLRRFNLSKDAMLTYYKTHMRPIVEYACPFWHAGLTKDQPNKLEGIKKRALQVILGDTLLPYEECLVLSGLTTLETRRHELLMGFGHGLLSSQKHRDILPPNTTQNKHDTRHSNKLQPYNPGATQQCRKSF